MNLIQFKKLKIFSVVVLTMSLALTSCKDSPVSSVEEEEVTLAMETMDGVSAANNETTSNVYISDENVLTYDHINAPTVSDWPTSVCKDNGSGSIGLNDPRWTRTDGQTAYNIRPLLGGGLHAFESWWQGIHSPTNFGEAEWINSVYKRKSTDMNPDGNGHNWTRYELPVDGNGTFELKLLADNCSWIYLDDQLVGYQDDAGLDNADNIRYGVTLDGPATLTYIIYDGGGDAGGKFRLETTTEDIPEFVPPTPEPNVYTSQAGLQTYEPILVPRNSDHGTSQCTDDGAIGQYVVGIDDPRWEQVDHGSYSVRNLLPANYNNEFTFERAWGGIHGLDEFNAEWINAKNAWQSGYTVPSDYSGALPYSQANWTRHELEVEGNGNFELKLLADDCSWIYLSDEDGSNPRVIGYQDNPGPNGPDKVNYGVTLDGKHLLTFIIFDQGGEAGGKFILETTTEVVPPYVPPTPVNNAPVADAGVDQSVTASGQTTSVTLDGSGSSDSDGDALTYSWTLNGNEVSTEVSPTQNLAKGTYTYTLTVSDGEESDIDEVTIIVANSAPVADAGEDQSMPATGQTTPVTLEGSGSDLDGDDLTYTWSNGATGATPTVNLPDGTHTLTLTVSDGEASDTDEVTITVVNTTPVANAGGNISKDATGQTTPVNLDGSGSSDADNDALSYSWTLNGDEVADTETATINLEDGDYIITLTVSDTQGASSSDEVSVSVINTIPEADAGDDIETEATGPTTSVTLSGSGSDADSDELTFSWSNGDAGSTTTVDLGVGVHTFTLTVSDGQGATDSDEVVVEITDTTAPVITYSQETNSLWPPNHKMVLVATGISASDIVDGATDVNIAVTSNEPSNGKGDGNTDIDYETRTNFDGSVDLYVRAERSGKGSGRTYTITMSTVDSSEQSSSISFDVQVAKSQGRSR